MSQGLSGSRLWLVLVVAVFCVPLFLNLGGADTRDDEAIYSFAVDRLLETGDWLEPKSIPNDDWVFLEKPPLKFWLVAAPIRLGLLPDNEFSRRFWDALFGALAFVYVFLIGCQLIGPACGAIAVLVLFVHEPLLIAHGLRSNNMEGPLFLAYCGGMFHFMAWKDARPAGRRWGHALAAALCFTLGFMTKFVAVLFLPLVIAIIGLCAPSVRKRLIEDWRIWLGASAVVAALVLPWFVWAHLKFGDFFWETIFGAAVVTRFTEFLDPTHLQPWHFYWTTIWARLRDAHITWLAAAGLIVLTVQTVVRRWVDGALVLLWFVLPLSLISIGTSKLYHYAYPFLPPLALAVGYLGGLVLALGPVVLGRLARWAEVHKPFTSRALHGGPLRAALLTIAVIAAAVAIYTVVLGPVRITLEGREVFKSSGVFRPLLLVVIASLLTGAARGAVPVVVAVLVVSLLPLPTYRYLLGRLSSETAPIRVARDCIRRVQYASNGPGVHVAMDRGELPYPLYYSFRHVRPMVFAESPDDLARHLRDEWPVISSEEAYTSFRHRTAPEALQTPGVAVFRDLGMDLVLLLPGPYPACEVEVAASSAPPRHGEATAMDLAEARERTAGDAAVEVRHPWETARLEVVRRLIDAHVALGPGAVVLDVGCGDTFVAERLAATYAGASLCAIDTAFTGELIASYRARLASTRVALYASLEDMPVPRHPVALVLLMDVIEHIADPSAFLRTLADRVYIDRDTRFLITVPAFQGLFCSHDVFLGHYRRYSSGLLRRHAAASGLEVDEIGYFFSSLLPLRLAQVVKERLTRAKPTTATTGLVTWSGGTASAEVFRRALVWDASVARWLNRIGVVVPGLSNYAICRKSA